MQFHLEARKAATPEALSTTIFVNVRIRSATRNADYGRDFYVVSYVSLRLHRVGPRKLFALALFVIYVSAGAHKRKGKERPTPT